MLNEIYVSTIHDIKTITDAKSLLYRHYVDELNWEFAVDNPSGLKIILDEKERKILVDDYDDDAIWFGGFSNNKLIACARICIRDDNSLLEMERYPVAKTILEKNLIGKQHLKLVEINREAIDFDFRNPLVYLLLFKSVIEYCAENDFSILMTTSNYDLITLFEKISFPMFSHMCFKYHENDSLPVNIYIANQQKNQLNNMLNQINLILKREINHDHQTSSIACI